MRILLALVVVAALAVGAYVLVSRDTTSRPRRVGSVTLVGDSLNVGIDPYLRDELDGLDDRRARPGRAARRGRASRSFVGSERRSRRSSSSASGRTTPTAPRASSASSSRTRSGSSGRAAACSGRRSCVAARRATGSTTCSRHARAEHPNVRLVDWASIVEREPEAPRVRHGARHARRATRAGPRRRRGGARLSGRLSGRAALPDRARDRAAAPALRVAAAGRGCRNIPRGASIVVVNHDSMADPFVVGAGDRPAAPLPREGGALARTG